MQRPHASEHARAIVLVFALTAAGCAVVFAGVGKLNHWAARKLQLSTESRRSLDTIPIERT